MYAHLVGRSVAHAWARRARTLLVVLSTFVLATSVGAEDEKGKGKKPDLPLEAADTLRFATDEGTWISLDVAPDGTWLVFELLGDLYRLPIAGGEAVRLTEGMAWDSQPRISPDGRWIAFVSDRNGADNLWIVDAAGEVGLDDAIDESGEGSDNSDGDTATDGRRKARQLSKEKKTAVISPAWTPDSRYVVVSIRGRTPTLKLFHVDGGSGITLGKASKGDGGGGGGGGGPTRIGATFSPDGRYLYFAESLDGRNRALLPRWQIARMDMQTGDVDRVTQAEGGGMRPALSPDGRLLVYATRTEGATGLRVRDVVRGSDRALVHPVEHDLQELGRPSRDLLPGYAFTPDGEALLVAWGGKIRRVELANGASRVVPFTAEVALDIGPDLTKPYPLERGPVRAKLVQDPQLSPDGERLVFSVLARLYAMDLPAGTPEPLTPEGTWAFKPAWSADGRWVAYVTWAVDGGHIWRLPADGSGAPEQLTRDPAFYTDLAWSRDGARIVALRGNAYQRRQTFSEFGGLRIPLDLVWLPADGGEVSLVVPARGIGAPHVADDPSRIYLYAEEGLLSLRYDGTDRRVHLKVTGPKNPRARKPPPAERVLMRPDGRFALAKVSNQLWLVAVPPAGGGVPEVAVRGPSVPAVRITDIGADHFSWADGGDTVVWAIGSTVYKRPFTSIDWRVKKKDEKNAEKTDETSGEGDDPTDAEAEVVTVAGEGAGDASEPKQAEKPPEPPHDEHEAVEAIDIALFFPRALAEGAMVLRGATVLTMVGDTVIEGADIVVENDRITAVGPSGSVTIPADAHEVDAEGTFVVPGFVDTHAHWEFRTHDVLEPHNWSLVANLAYGVTTGLDVQTSTHDYFAYHDLVETGRSLGQRALMTGPGIFSNNDFQSYDATLAYLRRYQQHYRTPNIKAYLTGDRKQRQWVVQASRALGLLPTTEGGGDLKLDLTHAIDGMHGNEHNLPVLDLYRDVVELYARTLTAYTPTLLVQYGGISAREHFFAQDTLHDDPKLRRFYPHNRLDEMAHRRGIWARDSEYTFDRVAASAAKIQRAGGLVGVGGHGELQGLGYHWEMWALAAGGMTPDEVLQAATLDGATIIGVEQDLGSVEVGKIADLVVLTEDPREDIRHTTSIRWVVKDGRLWDAETLDEVWPEKKELAPFWWWADAGVE